MGLDEVTARMTGGTGRAAAGRVMRRHQRECRPMTERWPVTWCGTWWRRSQFLCSPVRPLVGAEWALKTAGCAQRDIGLQAAVGAGGQDAES